MAEIVVKNGHVYVVDRQGQQHFDEFIIDACSDYDTKELEFLEMALKKGLVHVEEQVLFSRYEREKE